MRSNLTTRAVVVAACFGAAIHAFAGQPASCNTGMTQFYAHSWTEAAVNLANCEAAVPGQTDALLFRGKALINLRRYDEAAVSLDAYISKHAGSDDALYTLGYVQFRQDKPRESLATFTKAAEIKTPSSDDLKIVSLDYVLLADFENAAHYLEKALEMNPANVEARYHLGRVRYQLNEFDLAIAAFQDVLHREPNNMKAEYNLGLSFEGKNQFEDAITCYKKAIALERASEVRDEQPYLDLGALLSRSDRAPEAIPYLRQAVAIKSDSGKAQYELAKAYFGTVDFASALASGQNAIQLEPNESSYHYLLGRIYAKLGKPDLASAEFKTTDDLLKRKSVSHTPHSGTEKAQ